MGDPFYNTIAWKRLREMVRARDHNQCTGRGPHGGRLQVHHIIPRTARPDLALDPRNCRTLCHNCHKREHGGWGTTRPQSRQW